MIDERSINLETARIPWRELQGHFAQGVVIQVSATLDLVAVALAMAQDRRRDVETWIGGEQLVRVSDRQAGAWFHQNAVVWAVVAKPWVLVQAVDSGDD